MEEEGDVDQAGCRTDSKDIFFPQGFFPSAHPRGLSVFKEREGSFAEASPSFEETAALCHLLPVCTGIFLFVPTNAFQVPFPSQMCCINRRRREHHRRAGMLFLSGLRMGKRPGETSCPHLLESKVTGALMGAPAHRGQPRAMPLAGS